MLRISDCVRHPIRAVIQQTERQRIGNEINGAFCLYADGLRKRAQSLSSFLWRRHGMFTIRANTTAMKIVCKTSCFMSIWLLATKSGAFARPYAERLQVFLKYRPEKSGDRGVTPHHNTMKTNDTEIREGAQRELATEILKQAAQDLRRFYNRPAPIERELYSDAYRWVVSENGSWPFSFLNVCRLLNLAPDILRDELLGDLPLGTFGQWARRCQRTFRRRLSNSLTQRFTTESSVSGPDPASLVQTSY